MQGLDGGLEHKFHRFDAGLALGEEARISGYASVFGEVDGGGDKVQRGAYRTSLEAQARPSRPGGGVKMLWQHDPAQPIGIWDEIREDERGLWVSGRLLPEVARGREAAALVAAGAVDGLSIGYRVKRAERMAAGGRLLTEVELWEVSLVTFPMQQTARVSRKDDGVAQLFVALTEEFRRAREDLAQG